MARPYVIAVIGKSDKDPQSPLSPEALRAAETVGIAMRLAADPTATPTGAEKELES